MAQLSSTLRARHLVPLLLLASGCAASPAANLPATPASSSQAEPPSLAGSTGGQLVREAPRRVGDRLVHRYSGTYRSEALVIEEKVIGQEGDALVVDYVVLEGDAPLHLRVRMSVKSERIIDVVKVADFLETPASLADYERLMDKTAFATDQNRGLVSRSSHTCLVGPEEYDCVESRFDVQVAGQEGTLLVSRHPGLARDVAGEVIAVDGTVLYRADLIEFDRGPVAADTDPSVAMGETPGWAKK